MSDTDFACPKCRGVAMVRVQPLGQGSELGLCNVCGWLGDWNTTLVVPKKKARKLTSVQPTSSANTKKVKVDDLPPTSLELDIMKRDLLAMKEELG